MQVLMDELNKRLNVSYYGDRLVWCPNSRKTKVVSIPKDFANEGEKIHIWKLDDNTLIITKLNVFEFVKQFLRIKKKF